jgi:hypothetical protein
MLPLARLIVDDGNVNDRWWQSGPAHLPAAVQHAFGEIVRGTGCRLHAHHRTWTFLAAGAWSSTSRDDSTVTL